MKKIISWNVASIRARMDLLKRLLYEQKPDVVFLQEIKAQEEQFPFLELMSMGYYAVISGQKAWNGVAVLSKEPLTFVSNALSSFEDQARFVEVKLPDSTSLISVYVPNGVKTSIQTGSSSQDRQYSRTAVETQYGVSKTQINEYMQAGIIEEISVAVSIEESAIPTNMSLYELKVLIANAASPKVKAENVSIAFVESNSLILAPDKENALPEAAESGNPWWVVGALLSIGLIFGLSHIGKKVKTEAKKQEEELEYLRQIAASQEQQLKTVTQQASTLIAQQEQMTQSFIEQKNQYALALEQAKSMAQTKPNNALTNAIEELESDFNSMDENEAIEKIKNWIEST